MDDAPDPDPPSVRLPDESEGGEAACFAHLICDECGSVQPGPHHDGCSAAGEDAGR